MQKYINDIIGTSGSTLSPITGATCSVYLTGTSTLATLYSDNGVTPKANPISSSSTGRIEFYAADGRYDISVVKSGYTTVTLADILLEDLADATPGAFTTLSASESLNVSQAGSNVINPAASTTQIRIGASGFAGLRIGVDNSFNIDTYNSASPINVLKITQAGAATFNYGLAVTGTGSFVTSAGTFGIANYGGSSVKITSTATMAYEVGSTFEHQLRVNSANVGVFSSTGLAVTGTLSATGSGVVLTGTAATTFNYLQVVGSTTAAAYQYVANTGNQLRLGIESSAGGILATGSSAYAGLLSTTTTNPLQFGVNNVVGMTLDSSGNLGLGVTPSAWSGFKVFDLGNYSSLYNNNGNNSSGFGNNLYYNGTNWIYKNTGSASLYSQVSGVHTWYTAPSGTGGNAFSLTQSLAVGKGTTLALEGATSATGTGIAFPATQSASTGANTLDDYEEGTWTPTDGSGAALILSAVGFYTKIGNLVYASFRITYPVTANATASTVAGLPFTPIGFSSGASASGLRYTDAGFEFTLAVGNGSADFTPFLNTGSAIPNASFSAKRFDGMVIYQTA